MEYDDDDDNDDNNNNNSNNKGVYLFSCDIIFNELDIPVGQTERISASDHYGIVTTLCH